MVMEGFGEFDPGAVFLQSETRGGRKRGRNKAMTFFIKVGLHVSLSGEMLRFPEKACGIFYALTFDIVLGP
jgi:hypothetical protein